jgi:hypothetical protein
MGTAGIGGTWRAPMHAVSGKFSATCVIDNHIDRFETDKFSKEPLVVILRNLHKMVMRMQRSTATSRSVLFETGLCTFQAT